MEKKEWRKGKKESGREKFPELAFPSELEASRFVCLDGAPIFLHSPVFVKKYHDQF